MIKIRVKCSVLNCYPPFIELPHLSKQKSPANPISGRGLLTMKDSVKNYRP